MTKKIRNFERSVYMPSAALKAEVPRHAGNTTKKKGPENFRALVIGGGWFTTQELSIRTQACQRVLGRECKVVIKTQPQGRSYTGIVL